MTPAEFSQIIYDFIIGLFPLSLQSDPIVLLCSKVFLTCLILCVAYGLLVYPFKLIVKAGRPKKL